MARTKTTFSAVPVGDTFLDILSQENFVKTSDTHAKMLTQGNEIADEFEPDEPVFVDGDAAA
jgi:hypothetical protein